MSDLTGKRVIVSTPADETLRYQHMRGIALTDEPTEGNPAEHVCLVQFNGYQAYLYRGELEEVA